MPAPNLRSSVRREAFVVFVLVAGGLWLAGAPFRRVYHPDYIDIPTLVDGALLRPGAHWTDWFTRGYGDFWDLYREWPNHQTAFARPLFSWLVHVVSWGAGRAWASYLVLNAAAVGAVAALTWALARRALALSVAWSLASVALVLMSPPVHEGTLGGVGFASEPLASALVAGALLALLAARDGLAVGLLVLALLTKETALWATAAAGATVWLRDGAAPRGRRLGRAALVFLVPAGLWLAWRAGLHGGVGGTYATRELSTVLTELPRRLRGTPGVLVSQQELGALAVGLDHHVRLASKLVVLALFGWWLVATLVERRRAGAAGAGRPETFVALWVGFAMVFRLLLPLWSERYHVTLAMLLWPLLVQWLSRRPAPRRALAAGALAVVALASAPRVARSVLPATLRPQTNTFARETERASQRLASALDAVPPGTPRLYVVGLSKMLRVNPDILGVFFRTPAPLVWLVDVKWTAAPDRRSLGLHKEPAFGAVTLVGEVEGGEFSFAWAGLAGPELVGRHVERGELSYDLPEAKVTQHPHPLQAAIEPGRHVEIRLPPGARGRVLVDDPRGDALATLQIP
jgi:hypothetical protein